MCNAEKNCSIRFFKLTSMANSLLLIISLLLHFPRVLSVNCVSVTGEISKSSQGSVSIVKCDDPYTLISCGFRPSGYNHWYTQGSWMDEKYCYAENPIQSDGVYAVARCCDFSSYDIECDTFKSPPTVPGPDGEIDDEETNITCPLSFDYELLGCTANTGNNGSIDGAYSTNTPYWTWRYQPNTAFSTDNIC